MPFDGDVTVGEALARGPDPRLSYLYVIDREYRLVGVIHRGELENSEEDEVTLKPTYYEETGSLVEPDWHEVT